MITKNYIKMCEGNEDLQREWKPKFSDICINRFDGEVVIIVEKEVKAEEYKVLFVETGLKKQRDYWYSKGNLKYLPTQEQLWEKVKEIYFTENSELMIRNDLKRDIYSASIYTEIDDNIHTESSEGKTVKECLLKLIMKEYCKTWTGEKWVKEE